jgi:hypothetical protein
MEDPGELIRDPKALRALAHPFRWKLMDLLAAEGQCTATRCAEVLGESVASCSYHLNMLAKYGFVAEVPGPGRQKPWRIANWNQSWSREGADDETVLAAEAVTDAFLDNEFSMIRDRFRSKGLEPEEWRTALGINGYYEFLTADELREVRAEIDAIIERTKERREKPELRPEGARPVRFFLSTSVPKTT